MHVLPDRLAGTLEGELLVKMQRSLDTRAPNGRDGRPLADDFRAPEAWWFEPREDRLQFIERIRPPGNDEDCGKCEGRHRKSDRSRMRRAYATRSEASG